MGSVMKRRMRGLGWVVAMAAGAGVLPLGGCAGNDQITGAIETVAFVSTIPLVIFCGRNGSYSSGEGQFSQGGSNYEFLPSHGGGR